MPQRTVIGCTLLETYLRSRESLESKRSAPARGARSSSMVRVLTLTPARGSLLLVLFLFLLRLPLFRHDAGAMHSASESERSQAVCVRRHGAEHRAHLLSLHHHEPGVRRQGGAPRQLEGMPSRATNGQMPPLSSRGGNILSLETASDTYEYGTVVRFAIRPRAA